ncbi:MAG: hypothetical protein ACPGQR_02705, partial [Marinirhabdus sp.]
MVYSTLQNIHSWWAYLTLFAVMLAAVNAIAGLAINKRYRPNDYRVSLFALIVSHIQLMLGLVLYFVSPWGLKLFLNNGMGTV